MRLKFLNVIFFITFIVPCTSASCNQTCGGRKLPFPFGFSSGCQIQLNCSSSGRILASDFPVQSVTSDTIMITISATCNRSVEALRPLFTSNYAPTSHNEILLQNCNASRSGCVIPTTIVQTNFEQLDCNTKNDSINCYSEADNRRSFIDYMNLKRSGCRSLFSAVSMESFANASLASLDVQIVRMGWWIQGGCRCSKNSRCVPVLTPIEGNPPAYRCQCVEGFAGDGFRDGLGCRKGSMTGGKQHIIIAVAIASVLLSLGASLFIFKKFKQGKRKNKKEMQELMVLKGCTETTEFENDGRHDLKMFTYASILASTNNFSLNNKLGEGGFGPVYKGKMPEGRIIAIKVLSRGSKQGLLEFKTELILISKLQHRNLVKVLGFCIQGNEKMIVYDYVPNKSLDFFLFDPANKKELNWETRFNIINGIAQGLLYLHKHSRLLIVHRDLKASNILLDENMNPIISDFGLARIFNQNVTEANTSKRVGTYGYMAPEYVMQGTFSVKSDIYSFGVLILEIVSGRRNNSFQSLEGPLTLVHLTWELWKQSAELELVDPMLNSADTKDQLRRCIVVGLLCVQNRAIDRPPSEDVMSMLMNEKSLPMPRTPAFVVENNVAQNLQKSKSQKFSWNEVSVSSMDGR